MKRANRFVFLAALILAPSSRAAELPSLAGPIKGSLVLVGGGEIPDPVRARFIDLAGGKNAQLVYLPSAGTEASAAEKALETWKAGVASAVLVHVRNRADADDAGLIQPLTEATGVWVDGGDTYAGTALARALHKFLERGGVLGGLAAGEPALDFLPGVIVDAHALKRDRVNRLVGALRKHPGYAGIGVDDKTAIVVRGRSISVVGESYVAVCLSAGPNRPTSIQILRDGGRADLLALRRAALVRAGPAFPPEQPAAPRVANGSLVIGGGGGLATEIWKRFIDLAGGPESLIVVVPTASGEQVPADPSEARALRRAGAKNVKILHTHDRAEADRPEFAAQLKEARGLWFGGGRQWRFVDAYEGTATERAFHDVLRRGGVIGGSSAGASIQSEYMARGDPRGNLNIMAEGYERGFGFLPGVAVDQHFFARKRTADMTELMSAYPQLLGIGIDEGTVAIVRGSVMEVAGKSKIAVYDRRKPVPATGPDYEELPAGTRYDLAKRRRLEDESTK